MSKQTEITPEIVEKYEKTLYDEIKFGIIIALEWYETLNLKKLAQLVGRPETTTIRYVKQLLEDGLIAVDQEKTATSWGKFYQLSSSIKKLYAQRRKQGEEKTTELEKELFNYQNKSEEELRDFFTKTILSKENLENTILEAKQSTAFIHNLQRMLVNQFTSKLAELVPLIKKYDKEYLMKNLQFDPADIHIQNTVIKFATFKHMLKFYEIMRKFQLEAEKLKAEYEKEMDAAKIPEEKRRTFMMQLFAASMEINYTLQEEKKK